MSVRATRSASAPPIAVIGAGFSGTMAAIQLLEALPPERSVLLCERGGRFGRGRAYGTAEDTHLLNVRVSKMGAYPDRPRHFETWLSSLAGTGNEDLAGLKATSAGLFAPRGLYGRYLASLLTEAIRADGRPRLHLVQDGVTDLVPAAHGYDLRVEGGQTHAVAGAVLAMGNLASPGRPESRHRADPWDPDSFGRLHPDLPVLIVGTGLTMVDTVSTLRAQGFSGPIVAVSRHGLLPNVHEATQSWPVAEISKHDLATLSRLLRRVRAEVAAADGAGHDWRDVIDALRPVTDALWRSLAPSERARFLRHLRPFWDVHRHRTAPPAADTIRSEIARGTLEVRAGRILAIEDDAARAVVAIRPRGRSDTQRLEVQCILDATGVGRVEQTTDPLLQRLMARGLVRPGPFGIGLDADDDYRIRGTSSSAPLWTLGPLLRGVLWECIAVPDIRNQAVEVAASIATAFDRAQAA